MFTRSIRQWLGSLKDGELILAKQTYEEHFSDMKEATFYQLLARLCVEKTIGKLAKGLYFKPYKGDLERKPTKEDLIAFFTNKHRNGMIVGEQLLNNKGIISTDCKVVNIYTNVLEIKTKRNICGLNIQNVEVDFKSPIILQTIEILEIIENIDDYTNVNLEVLENILHEYANHYDAAILSKVLIKKSYKKRVVNAVKAILEHYGVQNDLVRYLNSASKYDFPKAIAEALEN